MTDYFYELKRDIRDGFDIIVDYTHEFTHPREVFDYDPVYDINEICHKIDSGELEWFALRVRAFFKGHEFGSASVGCCLYKSVDEVLTNGMADDLIYEAVTEAKSAVGTLREQLDVLVNT